MFWKQHVNWIFVLGYVHIVQNVQISHAYWYLLVIFGQDMDLETPVKHRLPLKPSSAPMEDDKEDCFAKIVALIQGWSVVTLAWWYSHMKPHAAQVADSITLHHVFRFVTNSLVDQQQQQQQQKQKQKQNHHHHRHHQMGRSNAFRVKPKENSYIGRWFQMIFVHRIKIPFD